MGLSIRTFITVPLVALTLTPAALVGLLSYSNSQRAIQQSANTLTLQLASRVRQQLRGYLATSHFVNQSTAQALESGALAWDQPRALEQHFIRQFEAAFATLGPELSQEAPDSVAFRHNQFSQSLHHIYLGTNQGTFVGAEYRLRQDEDPQSGWVLAVSRSDASTGGQLLQYALNDQKQVAAEPLDPPTGKPYDPRQRPWYGEGLALAEAMGVGEPRVGGWSPPYCDRTTEQPVITGVRPVMMGGRVGGVLGSDFLFSDVQAFLVGLLQQVGAGDRGFIFIVSDQGRVLVSSDTQLGKCDPDREVPLPLARELSESIIHELVQFKVDDSNQPHYSDFIRSAEHGDYFWTSWDFEEQYGLKGSVYVVIPREYFMAQIDRNNQITLGLCALGLLGAVGVSLIMADRIAKPVVNLEKATQKLVEALNQDQELDTITLDKNPFELYSLGQNFESMSSQLRRSFIAFNHFVPHNFLLTLGHRRPMDVNLGDSKLVPMTVLFSDIRSFTKMSESLTAAQTFQFINDYLHQMEPAITTNGGFIDKYIGDAIMALFDGEDSPDHGVQAGLEMLRRLDSYNDDRQRQNQSPIAIGIGIHTGNIALGTVGGENRWDTTVMGSDVNRASRIEGLTKDFQVGLIISGETLSQLRQSYLYRYLGATQVRGVEEMVKIYEVYGADRRELQEHKQQTQEQFEAGVAAYQAQDYPQALAYFQAVIAVAPAWGEDPHGGDRAACYYYQRCCDRVG